MSKRGLGQFTSAQEQLKRCLGVGGALTDWKRHSNAPIYYADNVRGLARDFTVPHSELATHVGAAGRPILAWTCSARSCAIAYEKRDGGCGYTDGLTSEVLPHDLQRLRQRGLAGLKGRRRRRRRRR